MEMENRDEDRDRDPAKKNMEVAIEKEAEIRWGY